MNYNIKWTQKYSGWQAIDLITQLEHLQEELTEQILNHEEFEWLESKQVLAKVMAK